MYQTSPILLLSDCRASHTLTTLLPVWFLRKISTLKLCFRPSLTAFILTPFRRFVSAPLAVPILRKSHRLGDFTMSSCGIPALTSRHQLLICVQTVLKGLFVSNLPLSNTLSIFFPILLGLDLKSFKFPQPNNSLIN